MTALPLKHTFSMIIGRAGKTSFVIKLLQTASKTIQPAPQKVYFCYTEWQKGYESLQNVEFQAEC